MRSAVVLLGVVLAAVAVLGGRLVTSSTPATVEPRSSTSTGTPGVASQAPVAPSASDASDGDPGKLTLLDRIERDYRAGVISADDAARYSLNSAIDPDYRAPPYAKYYDDAPQVDPQVLGMFAVSLYPELSPEAAAEIQEKFFTVAEPSARTEPARRDSRSP